MNDRGYQVRYYPHGRMVAPVRSPLFETIAECDQYVAENPHILRFPTECVFVKPHYRKAFYQVVKDYRGKHA